MWLFFFYVTCPFFNLKVFSLLTLSFYRKRSMRLQIKSLTSTNFLQINHFWAFIIFIVPVCRGHPQLIFGVAFCDGGTNNDFLKVKPLLCSFCYLSASFYTDSMFSMTVTENAYFFPFLASVFFLATLLLMCLSL